MGSENREFEGTFFIYDENGHEIEIGKFSNFIESEVNIEFESAFVNVRKLLYKDKDMEVYIHSFVLTLLENFKNS